MDVAIYARVSSDKQDVDLSISAQLRALTQFAETQGHQVARQFVDEVERAGASTGQSSRR
jgi:site-specific DNA recombinase